MNAANNHVRKPTSRFSPLRRDRGGRDQGARHWRSRPTDELVLRRARGNCIPIAVAFVDVGDENVMSFCMHMRKEYVCFSINMYAEPNAISLPQNAILSGPDSIFALKVNSSTLGSSSIMSISLHACEGSCLIVAMSQLQAQAHWILLNHLLRLLALQGSRSRRERHIPSSTLSTMQENSQWRCGCWCG